MILGEFPVIDGDGDNDDDNTDDDSSHALHHSHACTPCMICT